VRALAGLALAVVAAVSATGQTAGHDLGQAQSALQAGEADKALELLKPLTQSGASQAEAHNLSCRVLLTLEHWDAAAGECEQAVKMDGGNSEYHHWLGRALGERADRASFLNAYSLAKRARGEFEEAVRLTGRNAEALADLGEFYYSAPGVVGGGIDKAEGVVAQLDQVDGARAHELRGRIAEERKDFAAAERDFKQAIAVGAHPAFQWNALASYYRRRQRWEEMESAVHGCLTAAQRDKRAGVALYDGGSLLIATKRDPALAAKMIEAYLAGTVKSEEAPAFVAHTRLARLKAQAGDVEAAKAEKAAALALAHEYKPAQDLKF